MNIILDPLGWLQCAASPFFHPVPLQAKLQVQHLGRQPLWCPRVGYFEHFSNLANWDFMVDLLFYS